MRKVLTKIFIFLLTFALAIATTVAIVFFLQHQSASNELVGRSAQIATLTAEKEALQKQYDDALLAPAKECYSQSTDGWIVVNHPCAGEVLGKVFQFNGVGFGLFEGTLEYAIVDKDGSEVETGFLNTKATDVGLPGIFDKVINWDAGLTGTGKFLAFATSAADGSRIHIVEIPVTFE